MSTVRTFIDLFAGIGGIRSGLEGAGFQCVFSCEWDKYAAKTYEDNFGDKPVGDIRTVNAKDIPDHDLLAGGFPCQPFSQAGISKNNSLGRPSGFQDESRGTLFFEIVRVLKEKRPRAFLLENVKRLRTHDGGRTFKVIKGALVELGYSVQSEIMDSSSLVPQHRERIFIVGFREPTNFKFPSLNGPRLGLRSILEPNVSARYTLSAKMFACLERHAARHKEKGNGFGFGLADLDGPSRTLLARYYKDGSEILVPQGSTPRKLTPRECARLMGFSDSFRITCSDTRAYKQFGNSVVVPLIQRIGKNIMMALNGEFDEPVWGEDFTS